MLGLVGCQGGAGGSTTETPETTSSSTSIGTSEPTSGSTSTMGQVTEGLTGETGSSGQTTTPPTPSTSTSGDTGTSEGEDPPPPKPDALTHWVTGDPADADVAPTGPGLILMGGSTDVDAAFTWQTQYLAGGDVVVLRASGADGYNDYLFTDIGGVDSVETLLVDTPALAQEPYVAWTLAHAEAVFIAGGDQAVYMTAWKDTPVEDALMHVYARGGVIGGTSAGLAVLGEFVYAAYNDSVIEDEALLDPYNMYMTMDREFLALPPLAGVVTDSHFTARRRLCRLIGFVARIVEDGWAPQVLGIGVDEETALVVGPDLVGEVLGTGDVHLLHSNGPPQLCTAGEPLAYAELEWYTLAPGATVALPAGVPAGPPTLLSANDGALTPAYDCVE
ncbi:cyanophycinase [Nannocystis sp. SCPEA4]|uniref:cyanophycinase n=1 Tax=Nannocystis sp. SCPEA4 TaxID=2996787 RepID=UPI0022708E5C|nr:cyanophycinase [Nannocystis sp. SCPEA4]